MPGRTTSGAITLACIGLALLVSRGAEAHGDVHLRIEALTKEIAKAPTNADLYLKRGELSRVHQDVEGALSDYRKAAELDPGLEIVDFCAGRALFEAGRAQEARPFLDRYAHRHPADPEVFIVRARALALLGARPEAAADYDQAIALLARPKPDLFLERARVLVSAGRPGDALFGLEQGMARIGRGPALELEALDLEVSVGRFDEALERLDRMGKGAVRPEAWLVRRGEILEAAGRGAEARAAYGHALQGIEALPARRRSARATTELEERARAALARSETGKR